MRRSGGVSKILLMKKSKSKVYVSFLISLYSRTETIHGNMVCATNLFDDIDEK